MTREEAKARIEAHNNMIDTFINESLPKLLEMAGVNVTKKDNGGCEITMDAWFKAQDFINAMGFYKMAMNILNELKENGFIVKIDCQSNKLCLY